MAYSITSMHTPIPDVTHPGMIEEQGDMGDIAFLNNYLLSQGLADFTDLHLPFDGNQHSQLGDSQDLWFPHISTNNAGPWTIIDPSPQSPVGPCTAGTSQQELFGIKLADTTDETLLLFDGDEHSQPDDVLHIPASAKAFLPTSWTRTGASPPSQSPIGHGVEWPTVIPAAKDDLRAVVGSPQIRRAAGKQRKKDGIYRCPYRRAECSATFNARHNLQSHIYAHMSVKPYMCGKCTYAASSPGTVRRHELTCKGTDCVKRCSG
ncbi:hypothetical protein JOM56_014376 [Amanita muscaria]